MTGSPFLSLDFSVGGVRVIRFGAAAKAGGGEGKGVVVSRLDSP